MRHCKLCDTDKSDEEYNLKDTSTGRRSNFCKSCEQKFRAKKRSEKSQQRIADLLQMPNQFVSVSINHICYIAGIIDGEGCIHATCSQTGKNNYHTTVTVEIGNTCLKLLLTIKEILGVGTITEKKRSDLGKKQCWNMKIHSRQATALLEVILPHLIVKAEQASIAIQLGKTLVGKFGRRLTKDVIDNRKTLVQKISDLKRV